MNKRWLILLLALMAVILAYSWFIQRNVQWDFTLHPESKHPYGTRLFVDLLKQRQDENPEYVADYLDILLKKKEKSAHTYLSLSTHFERDSLEIEALKAHTLRGNHVVIVAQKISTVAFKQLLDQAAVQSFVTQHHKYIVLNQKNLGHKGDTLYQRNATDTIMLRYVFPVLINNPINSGLQIPVQHGAHPLMLKQKMGKGSLTLFMAPLTLSNYHLRNPEFKKYADLLVAPLPKGQWFLDVMTPLPPRKGATKKATQHKDSPLRYVLSQQGLKQAWYLMLTGAVLFLLFFVKRRQRPMHVYLPKENTSLDEVRTLSNLVQSNPNYKELVNIRVQFFLAYLRSNHQWEPTKGNHNLLKLHLKTGVKLSLLKSIMQKIEFIATANTLSEAFFLEIQRDLNEFYHQSLIRSRKINK